jgi:hypothetical protein
MAAAASDDLPLLVFLCHGSGAHRDETIFSILSALRHEVGAARAFRIAVYTDDAGGFEDLPVTVHVLDAATLAEWQGVDGYPHRTKTHTMIDVFERYRVPAVFSDSDTWWKRSPARVIERIRPGRCVFHLLETRLLDSPGHGRHALSQFIASTPFSGMDGRPLQIELNAEMWNSGIVGLHPDDAWLLAHARHLADQMWATIPRGPKYTLEQFTLTQTLSRSLDVTESDDCVFHYWLDDLRLPFRAALPGLLARTQDLDVKQRATVLHLHRPRPRGALRARQLAKLVYRSLGLRTPGIRSSAG